MKDNEKLVLDWCIEHLVKKTLDIIGPLTNKKAPILSKNSPKVFIDGGANFNLKTSPYLIVGDGDSYLGEIDILFQKNKDFSDLKGALNLLPKSIETLNLWGFLGGRRDHEWFNFLEAHSFLQASKAYRINFKNHLDKNEVIIFCGDMSFNHDLDFSVLSLSQDNRIHIGGDVAYPFEGDLEVMSSKGLSNIAKGVVSIKSEKPLILFLALA